MFKDNIGVQEELKVEMIDASQIKVDRMWLECHLEALKHLRILTLPRVALEDIIKDVEKLLG